MKRKAFGKQNRTQMRKAFRQSEAQEVGLLREKLSQNAEDMKQFAKFSELPLSNKTHEGLTSSHFVIMTDIQRNALPLALTGQDVLGAAKTGSGKTLAFLIPVLERLYLEGWTLHDGLGALILSPTRELAVQTFEVLKKIGCRHNFSAGLIIGGKDLRAEKEAISRMNILVATPGRLLQHMDQTEAFDWSNLQILVLDEADRILDLGFSKTVDAIVKQLPKQRQTLLFSATQASDIETLARLSLKDPKTISVHAEQASATPEKLTQYYMICPLPGKCDSLFSFVKANLSAKIIVFLSSCKQVRFLYEAFRSIQPGIPVSHLHGKQKQFKRMQIFQDFCRKKTALLFATDIAARGLDFPAVDWVVQVDCPEDVQTYIHRVGRTARYEAKGNGLLLLLPSEAPAMLEAFAAAKIPIASFYPPEKPAPKPKFSIKTKLQSLCSEDPEIKYLGQKALISYARSVHLQANKKVFKINELPLGEFALALGLPGAPKLRFIARSNEKNVSRQLAALANQVSEDESDEPEALADGIKERKYIAKSTSKTIEKMFSRKNADVLSKHFAKLRDVEDVVEGQGSLQDGDDDLFKIKRQDHDLEGIPEPKKAGPLSRRDHLKTLKKGKLKNAPEPQRVLFNDDDEGEEYLPYDKESTFDRNKAPELAKSFLRGEIENLGKVDKGDALRLKEMRRQKRAEKKEKRKEALLSGSDSKMARLGGSENSDNESDA